MSSFNKWLDTLVAEKGLDPEQVLAVKGESGTNYMPLAVVLDAMKATGSNEQNKIKATVVMIDFKNGSVLHYFKHLARALAI